MCNKIDYIAGQLTKKEYYFINPFIHRDVLCVSVHGCAHTHAEGPRAKHNAVQFATLGYSQDRLKSTTLKPEILQPCLFEVPLDE